MSVKTASKSKQAPELEQSVADVVVELTGAKRKKAIDALARAKKFDKIESDAAAAKEAEKKVLRDLLGEGTVATINGVPVFTNRWRFTDKVDKKALKERYANVWNAVVSPVKSRYLDRNPGSTIKS